MICLAYDGSLGGDWVARYAIRFAARSPERRLSLLHVADGSLASGQIEARIERLARECRAMGVEPCSEVLAPHGGTVGALLRAVPQSADTMLLCGTRLRARGQSYLRGTVTDQLLRLHPWPLLALRVVQPGQLGAPRDLLLPLAAAAGGVEPLLPALRLFLPDLERIHLLLGHPLSPFAQRRLAPERLQALRAAGNRQLAEAAAVLQRQRGEWSGHLDQSLALGSDWRREIVLHASRLKSGLILLGQPAPGKAAHWFGESWLEALLRTAPCDVAIVRLP